MQSIEADLQRIHTGQRTVGPDTVTLTPTRPPRRERPRVSPIYFGGLGMAVLALVGTIALNAYTHRGADTARPGLTKPAASASAPAAKETADVEPSEERAIPAALDGSEIEAREARAKPLRRKPRQRVKQSPQRDQAILDPWK
jgi:hypothetical protein